MYTIISFISLIYVHEVLSFGSNCGAPTKNIDLSKLQNQPKELPVNLRVAYFGDLGIKYESGAVLELVKHFDPDFVVHSGDFDYTDSPQDYFDMIDKVLGDDVPLFASIGNHELRAWQGPGGYQDLYQKRLERLNLTQYCVGDPLINHACVYKGMLMVYSGVGTLGTGHVDFVDDVFSQVPAKWKVCSWHKNQQLMQIEKKKDEAGWAIYEVCNQHGALLVAGHAHNICRTHMMSRYETQVYNTTVTGDKMDDVMTLRPGETFYVLSGVGGFSVRPSAEYLEYNPWWAVALSANSSLLPGSYLCTYNIEGTQTSRCGFVDIERKIWDHFYFTSDVPESQATTADRSCEGERIERQITKSDHDMSVAVGKSLFGCEERSLSNHILLTFENINLDVDKLQDIEYAFLEVHGYGEGDNSTIDISGITQQTKSFSCGSSVDLLQTKSDTAHVEWTDTADDWESGDVWVSPDISNIVKESVHDATWNKNGAITLNLKNNGDLKLSSFDESNCLAPSLVIQMKSKC